MPKLYLISYDVHKDNDTRDRVRKHLKNEGFHEALESAYVGHSEKDPMDLVKGIQADGQPGRVDVLLAEIDQYTGTAAPMRVMDALPKYSYDRSS